MVPLLDLWLPILLSAVFVFVASSLIHMALGYHKSDCGKLPNEEALLGALRVQGLPPGQYVFPRANSMKEMSSPEMRKKLEQGPVGYMNILPNGPFQIGKSLAQWFALSLVISACTAYVAGLGHGPGTDTLLVFRVTAAVALVGYAFSTVDNSIWKGVPWSNTVKFFIDGVVYALCTGAAFAWLWPDVAAAV
jgi:hypothetical protein